MQLIGRIGRRKIYYVQIRNNATWKITMPKKDWLAFTIANDEDEELVPTVVKACLDRNVAYTCSVGTYAAMTEAFFDEEIAWRGVEYEQKTKKELDDTYFPTTTAHKNLGVGLWFATKLAHSDKLEMDKVVCIDFTKKKVKNHLINLIEKMNSGSIPTDETNEILE